MIGFKFITVTDIVAAVSIKVAVEQSEGDNEPVIRTEVRARTTYLTAMPRTCVTKWCDKHVDLYPEKLLGNIVMVTARFTLNFSRTICRILTLSHP